MQIIVLDKNNPAVLKEEEHPEALVCSIYVVVVKFLSLTIWPFRSVFLEKSKEYEITIELYDADNQQIFVGEVILKYVKKQSCGQKNKNVATNF